MKPSKGPRPTYTLDEYLVEIRISKLTRLLVEGRSDKSLFERLFHRLCPSMAKTVVIDTAEALTHAAGPAGNRSKIEMLCERTRSFSISGRFVGFVDREFREFDFDGNIRDCLCEHRELGCLVWSRGHSAENYLFDFENYREQLEAHAPSSHFGRSVQMSQNTFLDAIRVACAIGLAGWHHQEPRLEVLSKTMSWEILAFDGDHLELDQSKWAMGLSKASLDDSWIEQAVLGFVHWRKLLDSVDSETIRWLCHGHLGVSVLRAAFGRCVFEISQSEGQTDSHRLANEFSERIRSLFPDAVASKWALCASLGTMSFPQRVLQKLGVMAEAAT